MKELILNNDVEKRVTESKRVIEAVVHQELDFEETISLIFERGMDSMLTDILGGIDQTTWLASFHQLAAKYPAEIYGYVAERLKRGDAVNAQERLRKRLGFHTQNASERDE